MYSGHVAALFWLLVSGVAFFEGVLVEEVRSHVLYCHSHCTYTHTHNTAIVLRSFPIKDVTNEHMLVIENHLIFKLSL